MPPSDDEPPPPQPPALLKSFADDGILPDAGLQVPEPTLLPRVPNKTALWTEIAVLESQLVVLVTNPPQPRKTEKNSLTSPSNTTTENTTTEIPQEPVTTFKTGSLSVRKDMMARLPAMHISSFKRNLHDVDNPCLKINELHLTSSNTEKLNLSEGALRVLNTPNAGGNSVWSEVLSMELMTMLYCAKLKATEMEIEYLSEGSITDYCVTMCGEVIGVSVTRAMKYRGVFSYEDALALLTKKLKGVLKSSNNVSEKHKWSKQVLHVWVQEPYMVALVEQAYAALSDLWGNTLVQLTVCGDNLAWIFK